MVGMVADAEAFTHELDGAPAGPRSGAISRGFRSFKNRPHQRPALARLQFGRPPRRRASLEAHETTPAMRTLPAAHRAAIDAKPLGVDVDGNVTLEQVHGAHPSAFEFGWASMWSHAHLAQGGQ